MTTQALSPWTLDAQWPVFAGHFPAHPVLPGALLLDWVVDAIAQQQGCAITGVTQVKFLRAAEPGDQLHLSLRCDGARARFEVTALRGAAEHPVASGIALLAITTDSVAQAAP